MKNNAYTFDHETNTLFITDAFKKAASKVGTPEYKIILQLRKDNPGMDIKKMENAPKKNAQPKLSYEQMKQFISLCRDAAERMATFNRVYALSQVQSSPYHYVKSWFLENYANYDDSNPTFDADGVVIVKTKAQIDAEKKAANTTCQDNIIPFETPQDEKDVS